MNCWSVCSHKSVWSWRILRGPERCSGNDRGRTAANRRWVHARRTTRLRSIAAAGPAPAWRCAICSTRSGRVTASRRAARICTFSKTWRWSVPIVSTQNDLEQLARSSRLPLKRLTLRSSLQIRGSMRRLSSRWRGQVSTALYSQLCRRRGGTCVSLCNEVATFPAAFLNVVRC